MAAAAVIIKLWRTSWPARYSRCTPGISCWWIIPFTYCRSRMSIADSIISFGMAVSRKSGSMDWFWSEVKGTFRRVHCVQYLHTCKNLKEHNSQASSVDKLSRIDSVYWSEAIMEKFSSHLFERASLCYYAAVCHAAFFSIAYWNPHFQSSHATLTVSTLRTWQQLKRMPCGMLQDM